APAMSESFLDLALDLRSILEQAIERLAEHLGLGPSEQEVRALIPARDPPRRSVLMIAVSVALCTICRHSAAVIACGRHPTVGSLMRRLIDDAIARALWPSDPRGIFAAPSEPATRRNKASEAQLWFRLHGGNRLRRRRSVVKPRRGGGIGDRPLPDFCGAASE